MNDLDDLLAPALPDNGGGAGSFDDVQVFVEQLIAPAYARELRDADTHAKWCPRWHEHPAAAWRLNALWRAWQALPDDDPDALCAWWLSRADPIMAALTDPVHGPFTGCGPTRHHQPRPLPSVSGRRVTAQSTPERDDTADKPSPCRTGFLPQNEFHGSGPHPKPAILKVE
jgi:hypothetical protein